MHPKRPEPKAKLMNYCSSTSAKKKSTYIALIAACVSIVVMLSNQRTNAMSANNGISGTSTSKSTITEKKISTGGIKIEYKLVEEKKGKHKRFAAFSHENDDNNVEINRSTSKLEPKLNLKPVSVKEWAEYISNDKTNKYLIEDWTKVINQSTATYDAYFFETKGTSYDNASHKQFEFVLVNSDSLSNFCISNGPEPETFGDYLNCSPSLSSSSLSTATPRGKETCCSFANLGHTATLISPKNLGNYSHIGLFMRNAPIYETQQLWKKITTEYLDALFKLKEKQGNKKSSSSSSSLWLSTSGLGVSWLHFRIDHRPKYYTYVPFAQEI